MALPLTVVGLMSGTSADAIDAAVLVVPDPPDIDSARRVRLHHAPLAPDRQHAIFSLFDTDRTTVRDVCGMNFEIGEWFAQAALAGIEAAGLTLDQVDLIGSHGQTVFHCPPGDDRGSVGAAAKGAAVAAVTGFPSAPCTLQIGEPAVIADRTGITTVADFRVRDVAAGGQGAPLVSYVDSLLFRHAQIGRAVLNLGGIANMTILPAAGDAAGRAADTPVIAFDSGPANMVIDWLMAEITGGRERFDANGQMASSGNPSDALLSKLLADPYFEAPPPKTTGRERYGAQYAAALWQRARALGLPPEDAVATATALTAETVALAIRAAERASPGAGSIQEVIAGGGGTRNPVLMASISQRLPGVRLTTHEDYGVSSQAKEALSFAILAAAAVRGQQNSVPTCTGARHPVVMGKIVPGRNYVSLMQRLFGGTPGEPRTGAASGSSYG